MVLLIQWIASKKGPNISKRLQIKIIKTLDTSASLHFVLTVHCVLFKCVGVTLEISPLVLNCFLVFCLFFASQIAHTEKVITLYCQVSIMGEWL